MRFRVGYLSDNSVTERGFRCIYRSFYCSRFPCSALAQCPVQAYGVEYALGEPPSKHLRMKLARSDNTHYEIVALIVTIFAFHGKGGLCLCHQEGIRSASQWHIHP